MSLSRLLPHGIALWVIAVQLGGPLVGLVDGSVVPEPAKKASEFDAEEAEDGEEVWGFLVSDVESDVHVRLQRADSASTAGAFPKGEWASHWCRPPPRV